MSLFGDRLRVVREQHKLKQNDLSEIFDISQNAISKYESGSREPSLDYIIAFCKHFDVTPDYLLGFSDIPKSVTCLVRKTNLSIDPLSDLPPEVREDVLSYAEFKRQQYLASTKQQEA